MRQLFLFVACAVAALSLAAVARAEGAFVVLLGPEEGCQVGPTDIPGVPVAIPAQCLVVFTPSGNANVLVRGELPAGFSLPETFSEVQPCAVPGVGFGSGRIVATKSGQITAHCHVRAST